MSFAKIYFLRNKFVLIASIKSFRVILCNFINRDLKLVGKDKLQLKG